MKWIVLSLVWVFFETWYFGWNMQPSCTAERYCDLLAVAMGCFGWGIITERNKKP